MVFGRTGCEETNDWRVIMYTIEEGTLVELTEQMSRKEAEKFYEKVKKELQSKSSDWFEVIKTRGDKTPKSWFIQKKSIVCILLERY